MIGIAPSPLRNHHFVLKASVSVKHHFSTLA
jgi:hypothetical protein